MLISDITVEVRDDSFNRIGQILPQDLVGFKAVLRFNNVGSWEITLPVGHDVGEILRLPGSGIIVTGPNGVILSGPTMTATNSKSRENPNGDWHISGVDDSVILAERLAYPDPTSADVTNQATPYDVRHEIASTAMYGYVSDNIGPTGAPQRRILNLGVGTDLGLGSYVYPAARFDVLGELLAGIASIDGLGFDVKQTDGVLEFNVFEPVDRSGYIRMDVANNTLSSTEYAYGSHSLSRAIVAGQGEGVNRTFVEVTSTESLSAETLWGRRIETFIDQRNTSDLDELAQAGQEKLADGGATLTSVDVVPSNDITMAYGEDWGLGDKVTVVVDEQEVQAVVTTVSMSIDSDGIRVGATVGEPTGVDYESKMAKRTTNTAQRVNALERKDVPAITWNDTDGTYEFALKGGNVTLQLGQEQVAYVKNNTGATLPNGSVVYPNGSTGTNQLVALAKADAEVTSSKTFGILTEDIANGAHGFVTTFGLVRDIDTASLTEGAAVYLSPTVAGGMTSTKPSARTRTNLSTNPRMVFTGGYPASNNVTLNPMTKNVAVPATHPQGITTCLVSQSTGTDNNALSLYGVDGLANTGSPQRASAIWVYVNESGYEVNGGGWTQTALTANTWTFVRQQTATAAGAWSALYIRKITGNASTTVRAYATGITTEAGTVAPERFFDGSTTDFTGASCSWTGATYTSPSIAKINEHMVLVGFCVRSHAVNGSIFVKVQNGFELDELHDVSITDVTAGEVVVRNSANSRWENATLAEAGIASVADLNTAVPAGVISPYAGVSAPTGYLMCQGQTVSRTTYANLFNALIQNKGTVTVTIASPGVFTLASHGLEIGDSVYLRTTGALPTGLAQNTRYYVATIPTTSTFTLTATRTDTTLGPTVGAAINTSGTQSGVHTLYTAPYGIGDGTTTFTLPDLRGRVPVGELSADAEFRALGAGNLASSKTVTLAEANLPSHTHTINHDHAAFTSGNDSPDHSHSTTWAYGATHNSNGGYAIGAAVTVYWYFGSSSGGASTRHQHSIDVPAFTGTSGATGSGTAVANLQPYVTVNYIIKY